MRRVASYSAWALFLATIFLFTGQIPQAQAAACVTPTQTSLTETGTTYTVQTFTSVAANCTWNVPAGVTSLRMLIVGGGGGAGFGSCGGGGGAGKVIISNNSLAVSPDAALILSIGNGGLGGWITSGDWRAGVNGETSSATVNGFTYYASGGGGGGGNTSASGLIGGSGGGGVACSSTAGGRADTGTVINGFTQYANYGGPGGTYGGGGGGAGGVGLSNGNGGAGLSLWGVTLAGGGGGWSGGTGGSSIGGSAKAGQDSKFNSGNPGVAGTGSGGGGGNDGGCGRIMIRYVVNSSLSTPTISTTPYKGISLTITVTSTVAGRIRFYALGKQIPRCLSNATSGTSPNFSATCVWTPPTRGYVTLTAIFTPSDSNYTVVNAAENKIFVLNRTTKR